ncbi:VOC family protein [bacterium]|nr:VOC family protein [bacterium]MBU1652995.1 VOC family protein [bacterium]MBU1882456.1 VOC family protein [bacterium]
MPTICHFEIPADDPPRCQKFYESLFGWKFEHQPQWDYYGITTGEPGKSVPGGMMKRQSPEHSVCNYIDVEDLEASAAKVKELGGQVVMERTAVPGMGWFVICLDTENNPFGLWHCDEKAK